MKVIQYNYKETVMMCTRTKTDVIEMTINKSI